LEMMKRELWKPSNTTNMKILQARFDWACSWAVMGWASIFNPVNSTILIHPKQWYAYGGEHRTFNAVVSVVLKQLLCSCSL
jgi:hypothetical protein